MLPLINKTKKIHIIINYHIYWLYLISDNKSKNTGVREIKLQV